MHLVSSRVALLCILFSWSDDLGKGFDPGVFGRFDLAALAQPHLKFLFVCLFVYRVPARWCLGREAILLR
jgi:hypothetical protein